MGKGSGTGEIINYDIFCIDLCLLNSCTIKGAYSLPRIDETLDCHGGSIIFTSVDLKSIGR